ncbi:MAG: hypothetical protein HC914_12510, partial [Chloroflexaceae bacterium]|nr:hypothetical protein [Chloroflexaceae bacterium]
MSYYMRILVAIAVLMVLIGLVIWHGPQQRDVVAVARAPEGEAVPVGTPIRITFSRPVDRLSVENTFRLDPPTSGSFFWEGQQMTFRPTAPLQSDTTYQITIPAGMRDQRGTANTQDIGWTFRTRLPNVLVLATAEDGSSVLWLAPIADPTLAREIYRERQGILDIAVAPGGLQALITVVREPQRTALLLLDLTDGTTRPLVDDPAASAGGAAWSPTSDVIVYERRSIGTDTVGQPKIWLAQPDGTSLGPIANEPQISYAPVWSPDGQRLAFIDGGAQAIGVYNLATNQLSRFPDSSGEAPVWLPDGMALAYTSIDLATNDGPATRPSSGGPASAMAQLRRLRLRAPVIRRGRPMVHSLCMCNAPPT